MNLAALHVLAKIRAGATLDHLIAQNHPCLARLTWADLQAIDAELEADVQRARTGT